MICTCIAYLMRYNARNKTNLKSYQGVCPCEVWKDCKKYITSYPIDNYKWTNKYLTWEVECFCLEHGLQWREVNNEKLADDGASHGQKEYTIGE